MIPIRTVPDIFKDVREFLQLSQPDMMHKLGERIRPKVASLAWKLIDEEVNKELKEDLERLIRGDYSREIVVRVFDHYLDIIYVAAWAIEAFGLPAHAGWNELQRANMSKFPSIAEQEFNEMTGQPALPMPMDIPEYKGIGIKWMQRNGRFILTNEDTGKVMKPAGFTPPQIWEVLFACETIQKLREMQDVIATPFMNDYFHEVEKRIAEGKGAV